MMYLLWLALIPILWIKLGVAFGLIVLFTGFIDIIIHFVKKQKNKPEDKNE